MWRQIWTLNPEKLSENSLIKVKFKTHGEDEAGEEKVARDGKINKPASNKNLKKKRENPTEDNHKENLLFVELVKRKMKRPLF